MPNAPMNPPAPAAATPPADPPKQLTDFQRFYNYVTTTEFVSQVAPFFNGSEVQAREFVRVILNAVQKTPDLLYADRKSLLLSCMAAARDRLMPDGKKALLTVYRAKEKIGGREVYIDKVEYQPMAAGMIQKLYDSGNVTYADACAVYEKDLFEYERGDNPRISHKPTPANDPGPIVAAYMVVKLKSGETKREVMFKRDIDRVHAASKAPGSPAWKQWPDQMAIKAVIKRGYKQLPSSPDVEALINHDNAVAGFSDFADDIPENVGGNVSAVDKINSEVTGGTTTAAEGAKDPATPAAIEHKPDNKVPPVTIESNAAREPETVQATATTDAVDTRTFADGVEDKRTRQESASGPTFADVGALVARAQKERKPALLDDASELARGIQDAHHKRDANLAIADARQALARDDGK